MTRLYGMNVAGAALAQTVWPGVEGVDYIFPTLADLAGWKAMGFDAARFSVMWERLQPIIGGPLDAKYLAGCLCVLDDAQTAGIKVLLDLHNYGKYRGELIGTHAVPLSAFTDTWKRLAAAFHARPALLAYGLMNEPCDASWTTSAQSGVDGIRASGDWLHPIYVAGTRWGQCGDWSTYNAAGPFVHDPAGKEVYEAHLYLDADASGRYLDLTDSTLACQRLADRLKSFTDWLTKYGKVGAIGEFGVPSLGDAGWMNAVSAFYEAMRVQGMTSFYWGGGLPAQNAGCLLDMPIGQTLIRRPATQLISTNLASWKLA